MEIYAVYWREGWEARQYSVLIGQCIELIGSYWPKEVAQYDMRED